MAPAAVAPAPINAAEEAGVVTRLSILTGSLLQALQTEPAPAPRAAVVAVVVELIVEPVALARRVASLQDNEVSLAFFANAKATLMAQESCIGDLRSLTEQARVYFPSGGLKLDESGIAQARLIAALAQDCNGVEIIVEGHSDPSGDPASQLKARGASHSTPRCDASRYLQFQSVRFGQCAPLQCDGFRK